jgi:DNA-directed RNA polymerase subunit RPC12/RpoP
MPKCSRCTGIVSPEDTECPFCGFRFEMHKKERKDNVESYEPGQRPAPVAMTLSRKEPERERGVVRQMLDPFGVFDGII